MMRDTSVAVLLSSALRAGGSHKLVRTIGCVSVLIFCCQTTHALTIRRVFPDSTPPSNTAGGGNLRDICNAAADMWEARITDSHTVTITFRWGRMTGTTLAEHRLTSEGGTPHRETAGQIVFDNDGSSIFYLDPTPARTSSDEFTELQSPSEDRGGGNINVARYYRRPHGRAIGRTDVKTVAVHEIGHALGMARALNTYASRVGSDNEIDVTSPRPRPGTRLPVRPVSVSAHLRPDVFSNAVLVPTIPAGRRRLTSGADLLANAQISEFSNVRLP